ncbi:hypothetical protein [Nocardia sp. XZ_19_385]|uniref:hypothetical protein n=1 Tax=Nocardia sp. XZ_19_385 TaxID=2769488 RepID=UPI00188EC2D3|nr:hypothetical protein [Nocardia sp. XZ_19_385]
MSYVYIIVPAGVVSTPDQVMAYYRSQAGRPIEDDLQLTLIPGMESWNRAIPLSRAHARVRLEAAGNAVRITAADRLDRRRTRGSAVDYAAPAVRRIIEALIAGFGYAIYDARSHTLSPADGDR